ncbi:MAG: FtsQ-type POTRA domain-containing protein [Gammaproteobacteria bacterium]|nr:FtsQ-type POTRA domain-containing protein [Gammaproteobacteria bacterium]
MIAERANTINYAAVATALRFVIALGFLVAFSYAADWLLRAENYPVRALYFEGPFKHVQHRKLEAAVLSTVRGNFFLVDLTAVRQRLESVPWVQGVSVRRRFPQDIVVEFTEQQLIARWGDAAWVNSNGEVVRVDGSDLPTDLPRLAGPDGTAPQVLTAFSDFQASLAKLNLRLTGLSLTARRSWRLELDGAAEGGPLVLVLDHQQPQARLERFAQVYGATLAEQAHAIKQVDLRYTNGFAVEWRDPNAASASTAEAAASRNEG